MRAMNLAKVSANGKVTLPLEIRNLLRIREGDKLLFRQAENGDVVVANANTFAIEEAQAAFQGVAEGIGSPSADDIQSWVDEIRYGKTDAP
jgi:AbrB family looped-hinge helix DNA binding protein